MVSPPPEGNLYHPCGWMTFTLSAFQTIHDGAFLDACTKKMEGSDSHADTPDHLPGLQEKKGDHAQGGRITHSPYGGLTRCLTNRRTYNENIQEQSDFSAVDTHGRTPVALEMRNSDQKPPSLRRLSPPG